MTLMIHLSMMTILTLLILLKKKIDLLETELDNRAYIYDYRFSLMQIPSYCPVARVKSYFILNLEKIEDLEKTRRYPTLSRYVELK